MSWNYRVLDHGTHLAVHEVFYDERGNIKGWTAEPITFSGDTIEELRDSLAQALEDAGKWPVVDLEAEEARLLAEKTSPPE